MANDSSIAWSAIGGIIAIVMLSFTIFRYVAGIRDILTEKISSETKTSDTKIDSVSRETRLLIEKLQENISKTQHDFANSIMGLLKDVRADAKILEEKYNNIIRDMVKQEDLRVMRSELVGALKEQDRSRVDALDRLEQRLTAAMKESKAN